MGEMARTLRSGGKLFVIDWQTTPKIGGTVTCGTRYFDLMLFIYSLFYSPRGRSRYKIHLPGDVLATAFIEGYFANLQARIDIEKFRLYMRKFYLGKVSSRIEKRKFKRFVLLIPCHIKLKKFIRKFKITGVQ